MLRARAGQAGFAGRVMGCGVARQGGQGAGVRGRGIKGRGRTRLPPPR